MAVEKGYREGYVAGLRRARAMVLAAPTVQPAFTRITNMPGGFPRVADTAADPDGDPNVVTCLYALRDAVLHWIDQEVEQNVP